MSTDDNFLRWHCAWQCNGNVCLAALGHAINIYKQMTVTLLALNYYFLFPLKLF